MDFQMIRSTVSEMFLTRQFHGRGRAGSPTPIAASPASKVMGSLTALCSWTWVRTGDTPHHTPVGEASSATFLSSAINKC